MKKQYYLIRETTLFVDTNGGLDVGGVTKKIVYGKDWDNFYERYIEAKNKYLNYYQYSEFVSCESLELDVDGYNTEVHSFNIKKLTQKQVNKYLPIIKAWDKI